MKSQLVRLGGLQPLHQRLWMRLTHDLARSTEVPANARSVPLFDESDTDNSDYDSDDGYVTDCSSNDSVDSEDEDGSLSSTSTLQSLTEMAFNTLQAASNQACESQSKCNSAAVLDKGEDEKHEGVVYEPGTCVYDLTHYCTLNDEDCPGVASKLGCHWKDLANANKKRYGTITYTCKFMLGTILAMPETVDLAKLLKLRKPLSEKETEGTKGSAVIPPEKPDGLPWGRDEDSAGASGKAITSDDSKCGSDAEEAASAEKFKTISTNDSKSGPDLGISAIAEKFMFQPVEGGVGFTCQRCFGVPEQFRASNYRWKESEPENKMRCHHRQCAGQAIHLGRLVESVVGFACKVSGMSLDEIVGANFVAIVKALVGGNEDLAGFFAERVRAAALDESNILCSTADFPRRIFDQVQVKNDDLTRALADFARSKGGLFDLVTNEHFIVFAKLVDPECVLPTPREVMEYW